MSSVTPDTKRIVDSVESFRLAFRTMDREVLARIAAIYFVAVDEAGAELLEVVRPVIESMSEYEKIELAEAMTASGDNADIVFKRLQPK